MPERAGGGWYPLARGLSAADLYAQWLNERDAEDTRERRQEFADAMMPEANATLRDDLQTLLRGD